jgi:hypothetical protein
MMQENPLTVPKKWPSRLGILLALLVLTGPGLFGLAGFYRMLGFKEANIPVMYISRSLYWLCLGLTWLYARKAEKKPLLLYEERGYKFWQYLVSGIGIFGVLIIVLIIAGAILKALGYNPVSEQFDKMMVFFRKDYFLVVFTCLTAGFTEELIFRGYLLPRMEELFRIPVVAIFVNAAVFGLLHIGYGTIYQLIGPFLIGLVFSFYYREFRNIKVLIACHFLWDLAALSLKIYITKH